VALKSEVQDVQEKIHPKFSEAKVVCGCGNTFVTGSVKKELRVDVCSKCHPFYTGQQRQIAAGGRVERFNKRYGSNTQE
jgi:large subunit ribosomal protein L31